MPLDISTANVSRKLVVVFITALVEEEDLMLRRDREGRVDGNI